MIKRFLQENYAFRRNLLSGKIEFAERTANEVQPFRVFTKEEENSLAGVVCEALPDVTEVKTTIKTVVESRLTPDYDPIREYILALPEWDGKNHVDALLNRLPGLDSERRYWMTIWLRSMVAHWMQMDSMHGNEVVPTLIGDQGCGKSTFCRRLLPQRFHEYFLDNVNLGNRHDKEMALTNNLLVNIDELEQIHVRQQSNLKHLISTSRVNGRTIYGKVQSDRSRYTSFVATTNNLHPLHDPTGSRRYLCIRLTSGYLIDNDTPINYEQLYAQIWHEVCEGQRYWFTDEEQRSLQRTNTPYQSTVDLEVILNSCFRKPKADEACEPKRMSEIIQIISEQYPFVRPTHGTKLQIGFALKACNYVKVRDHSSSKYFVIKK